MTRFAKAFEKKNCEKKRNFAQQNSSNNDVCHEKYINTVVKEKDTFVKRILLHSCKYFQKTSFYRAIYSKLDLYGKGFM